MNNNFLKLDKISKEYVTQGSSALALDNISISIPERGLIFVVGKSGSGKSSLLNIIGGIDVPTGGSIAVGGATIDHSNERLLNSYRSNMVGFVFQDYCLIEDFSIRDNLKIPLISCGTDVDDSELDRLLKLVDLYDHRDKRPSCLSGGERQRAAIIRALAKKPKILLADEPTGNLDGEASIKIFQILKTLSEDMPVIVVTHDSLCAYEFADRIIELESGKIISDMSRSHRDDLSEIKREYKVRLKNMYSKSEEATEKTDPSEAPTFEKKPPMPLRSAAFISFSHLKNRITSTILLILILAIALMGIGLVYTYAEFDNTESLALMLEENDHRSLAIVHGDITKTNKIDYINDTFTHRDYLNFASKYGKAYKVYAYLYTFESYRDDFDYTDHEDVEEGRSTDLMTILGLCELEEEIGENELGLFFGSKLVAGAYPQKQTDVVEILISDVVSDRILQNGVVFDNGIVYPSSTYESLVGKVVNIDGVNIRIAGVYSSRYKGKYDDKNNLDYNDKEQLFASQFVYPIAITNKGAIEGQAKQKSAFFGTLNLVEEGSLLPHEISTVFAACDTQVDALNLAKEYEVSVLFSPEYEKKSIANNEIILSYDLYCEIFNKQKFNDIGERIDSFWQIEPKNLIDLKFKVSLSENYEKEYTVVGIFENIEDYGGVAVVNNLSLEETVNNSFEMASLLIPTVENDISQMITELNANGTVVAVPENAEMLQVSMWFSVSKSTMVLATVVIAIFIMIIMYAIISKNIGENRKNIGILRTFGVTRADLVKVYLLIDIVYFVCAFALGIALYLVGCHTVNALMSSAIGLNLTLLVAKPLAIILMLAASIVSITLSSALPIYKYTKITPDQVIRRID